MSDNQLRVQFTPDYDMLFVCYSGNDQKCQKGNQIEEQEKDFEQSDKRIENHVESLTGHGEKLVLGEVDQLRGQHGHDYPEDKQATVDYG
jgi:hypothetical protein